MPPEQKPQIIAHNLMPELTEAQKLKDIRRSKILRIFVAPLIALATVWSVLGWYISVAISDSQGPNSGMMFDIDSGDMFGIFFAIAVLFGFPTIAIMALDKLSDYVTISEDDTTNVLSVGLIAFAFIEILLLGNIFHWNVIINAILFLVISFPIGIVVALVVESVSQRKTSTPLNFAAAICVVILAITIGYKIIS